MNPYALSENKAAKHRLIFRRMTESLRREGSIKFPGLSPRSATPSRADTSQAFLARICQKMESLLAVESSYRGGYGTMEVRGNSQCGWLTSESYDSQLRYSGLYFNFTPAAIDSVSAHENPDGTLCLYHRHINRSEPGINTFQIWHFKS